MAAQPVPHPSTDKKRVKVYELRNNDWFDRGTGFCTAIYTQNEETQSKDARVVVESEDQPDRVLLETRICKEDGFQKQQETLIVWTEPSNGVDMALSFQEAEGCALIWKFVNSVQQSFHSLNGAPEDNLSDDLAMDMSSTISLPPADLNTLAEIESQMRMMSGTANGRDALAKFIMTEDYIGKLIPLVEIAEDLEGLADLHRLCNIMKIVILLNDTSIIEHAVSDECVLGVVGALEYDPDFPSHKANHRQWLQNEGRFKEVVPIEDDQIRKKIHQTYRLQYLKDVVLARILDDPTFSVLNSLIFFNQVDIVQHLQGNGKFLNELFDIFAVGKATAAQKKDGVLFIQQCCAIAKNLQPPARQTLYNNFIAHGLLSVINFGLRHSDVAVRVGATDILVSMIDHDPWLIRNTIYRQIHEKQPPLTDSLIDLLLVEVDLGVKSQISDALKVLLDQGPPAQPDAAFAKANGEYAARAAAARMQSIGAVNDQQDGFLTIFYERSAAKLFKPLINLEGREVMSFTTQQSSMFTYLVEILNFFIRQHQHRVKFFILQHNIAERITQLLSCREKFIKLVAVRFFRQVVNLQDEFYIKHIAEKKCLAPILDVLIESVRRDNLLSSACLDFFEHIKKENVKDLVKHLVENYRPKIEQLDSLETFRDLLLRYDQTRGFTTNMDYFIETEEDVGRRRANATSRAMMGQIADPTEEEYWNTSDDEEELQRAAEATAINGTSPSTKLVDYASDDDVEDNPDADALSSSPEEVKGKSDKMDESESRSGDSTAVAPPERISEKRRREDDEDEDLGKLIQNKRRNSSSASSNASTSSNLLRKQKCVAGSKEATGGAPKKIAISLTPSVKAGNGDVGNDDE